MSKNLTEQEKLEIERLKEELETKDALEELYENAKLAIFDVEPEKKR